jgi:hypothetical protein
MRERRVFVEGVLEVEYRVLGEEWGGTVQMDIIEMRKTI